MSAAPEDEQSLRGRFIFGPEGRTFEKYFDTHFSTSTSTFLSLEIRCAYFGVFMKLHKRTLQPHELQASSRGFRNSSSATSQSPRHRDAPWPSPNKERAEQRRNDHEKDPSLPRPPRPRFWAGRRYWPLPFRPCRFARRRTRRCGCGRRGFHGRVVPWQASAAALFKPTASAAVRFKPTSAARRSIAGRWRAKASATASTIGRGGFRGGYRGGGLAAGSGSSGYSMVIGKPVRPTASTRRFPAAARVDAGRRRFDAARRRRDRPESPT